MHSPSFAYGTDREEVALSGLRKRSASSRWGAGSSRVHLPTTRQAAGVTPSGAAGSVGREPKTWCDQIVAPDSGHRPAPGRSFGGTAADAGPVPEQAATLGLKWLGDRDARQWAILLPGRSATTRQETRSASRAQSKPSPRCQMDLQERGSQGQQPIWPPPRVS